MPIMKPACFLLPAVLAPTLLAGCATTGVASSNVLFGNAAKVHIYTPEERSFRPGMLTEQIGATGEVNYCNAGLASLIEARRKEALAAVAQACGGEDKYRVRFEGLGNVQARYLGNFQITNSCNRSHVVIFKCTGVEPKPDMSK